MKTFTHRELIDGGYTCASEDCSICNQEYVLLADAEGECKTLWERANDLSSKNDTMYRALERLRGIGEQTISGPVGIVNAVLNKLSEYISKLTEANYERQRLEKVNADLTGQISLHVSSRDYWYDRARDAEKKLDSKPVDLGLMYQLKPGMVFPFDARTKTLQVTVELMGAMVDVRNQLVDVLGVQEGEDIVLVARDIVADRNVARAELRAAHRAIDSKDEQIEDLRDEVNLSVARQQRVDNENNDLRTTLRQMNRYAETRINTIARLRNTIGSIEKRVNDWYAQPIENSVLKEVTNTCEFADDVRTLCKNAEDPQPTTGETAAANGNSR
jgi:hypothetical protein